MKRIIFFVFYFISLSTFLCAQDKPKVSEKLEKIWVAKGLSVPESVLLLPEKGILYVSNIAEEASSAKNGNGYISILTVDGKIKEEKWITGLNSPKGMAIVNEKLYVTEVDRIAEIDLAKGKKTKAFPVEGAKFLNDITSDSKGNLYISDSQTGTIHKMSKGKISEFVKSDKFPFPNGVVVSGNNLFIGTGEKIVKVDLETRKMSDYMLNTDGVDGLALINDNYVIFSDWPGKIHLMKQGEEKEIIFDSTALEKFKTADFAFDPKKQLIYIPTFFNNSVICYKLKP